MSRKAGKGKRAHPSRQPFDASWLMVGACALVFLLAPWQWGGFDLSANLRLHFAVSALVLADLVLSRRCAVIPIAGPQLVLMSGLVAWHVIASLWSSYHRASVLETLRVLDSVALAVVASRHCLTTNHAMGLLAAVVVGAAGVGRETAILQRASEDPNTRALGGSFAHQNVSALYAAMALPLALGLWGAVRAREQERTSRRPLDAVIIDLVAAVLIVAIGAGLWATGSRGGLFAASTGIGLAVVLAAAFIVQHRLARITALLALLLGFAGVGLIVHRISQRAKLTPTASDHSSRFRVLTWKATARMIAARPVTGHGAGAFRQTFPRYEIAGYTAHAHQNFLQLMAETGVVGGLILFGLLCSSLRCTTGVARQGAQRQHRWLAVGLGGCMATFAAHSLVDSGWYIAAVSNLFFLVCALSVGAQPIAPPVRRPHDASVAGLFVLTSAYGLVAWSGEQHFQEAGRLRREGAVNSAIEAARAAVALDASSGEYHQRLAHLLRDRYLQLRADEHDRAEALRQYDAAAMRMPTSPGPPLMRAHFLRKLAQETRACADYRRALRNEPHNSEARVALAETLLTLGDRDGAQRNFLRVAERAERWGKFHAVPQLIDIHVARALMGLAELAAEDGNAQPARQYVQRARKLIDNALELERSYWSKIREAMGEMGVAAEEEWKSLDERARRWEGA